MLKCKINEKVSKDVRRNNRTEQEKVVCTWDYGDWPTWKELYDRRNISSYIQYENDPHTHKHTHTKLHMVITSVVYVLQHFAQLAWRQSIRFDLSLI